MKSRVEARRTSPVGLTVVVEQLGIACLTVLGLEKREKVVVRNVNILVLVKTTLHAYQGRPSARRGAPPHQQAQPARLEGWADVCGQVALRQTLPDACFASRWPRRKSALIGKSSLSSVLGGAATLVSGSFSSQGNVAGRQQQLSGCGAAPQAGAEGVGTHGAFAQPESHRLVEVLCQPGQGPAEVAVDQQLRHAGVASGEEAGATSVAAAPSRPLAPNPRGNGRHSAPRQLEKGSNGGIGKR